MGPDVKGNPLYISVYLLIASYILGEFIFPKYPLLHFFNLFGILIIILMVILTLSSDAFLTPRNLLNILNQNAPLAIIACALTLVIIVGGFDLSTGAIFAVASVSSAWIAINYNPYIGLLIRCPKCHHGLGP